MQIQLQQMLDGTASVAIDGGVRISVTVPAGAIGGGLAIQAMVGTALSVSEMLLSETDPAPAQHWIALLPSDGITSVSAHYASGGPGWDARVSSAFRTGAGFVHPGSTFNGLWPFGWLWSIPGLI